MSTRQGRPRSWKRFAMALMALLCIILQFSGTLSLAALALVMWLLTLLVGDPEGLRRLWRPRFWLITLIVALLSGLLLGPRDYSLFGLHWSRLGLEAGALMVIRGAFLFSLAVWASRTLNAADIHRLFSRVGLGRLGTAVTTAMNLLPHMESRLSSIHREARSASWWQFPWVIMRGLIREAAILATVDPMDGALEGVEALRVAVIGPPKTGKTTMVNRLAQALRGRGWSIGGISQPALQQDRHRAGYRLRDEATGEEHPFADRVLTARPGAPRFRLDPQGFAWAANRIQQARRDCDVLVVDELGRLEGRGDGHVGALLIPIRGERVRVRLYGVRADQCERVEQWLGAFDHRIAPEASASEIHRLIEVIAERAFGCATGAQATVLLDEHKEMVT